MSTCVYFFSFSLPFPPLFLSLTLPWHFCLASLNPHAALNTLAHTHTVAYTLATPLLGFTSAFWAAPPLTVQPCSSASRGRGKECMREKGRHTHTNTHTQQHTRYQVRRHIRPECPGLDYVLTIAQCPAMLQ